MMGIRLQNVFRIGIFFSGPSHGANKPTGGRMFPFCLYIQYKIKRAKHQIHNRVEALLFGKTKK
ncbi:hypothetical protein NC651_026057 [Populus alba x Populus x berolinensis]|nr:hypothetical protein NC651_026057 [Populus alba x Populus x berolinensis]